MVLRSVFRSLREGGAVVLTWVMNAILFVFGTAPVVFPPYEALGVVAREFHSAEVAFG